MGPVDKGEGPDSSDPKVLINVALLIPEKSMHRSVSPLPDDAKRLYIPTSFIFHFSFRRDSFPEKIRQLHGRFSSFSHPWREMELDRLKASCVKKHGAEIVGETQRIVVRHGEGP